MGQLLSLIDGRVRCRCYDGHMRTDVVKTEGLATTIHMTCDGCNEVEVWEADETRVLFWYTFSEQDNKCIDGAHCIRNDGCWDGKSQL